MYIIGPKLKLRCNSRFVITGAKFDSYLDNEPLENNKVYSFRVGQILKVGRVKAGLRCYLKFEGTFKIPKILNSKSFFTLLQNQYLLMMAKSMSLYLRLKILILK